MASETITKNDLTAILNNVLPSKNVFVANNAAESNLNWILKGGVYKFDPSSAGCPFGRYGMLIHICTAESAGEWHWQLAFATDNMVYARANINASSDYGGNWTSWKALTT